MKKLLNNIIREELDKLTNKSVDNRNSLLKRIIREELLAEQSSGYWKHKILNYYLYLILVVAVLFLIFRNYQL